jgi:fatty acid amide hydrolase 2
MEELLSLPAIRLAQLIRERAVSPVEVVDAHLTRIEAVNPALNAVVASLAERAREQARRAEAALLAGEATGPLHGVPITVKDCLDMNGVRSTGGVTWRADHIARGDAVAVARMQAAGAIVVGRTNLPDLSMAHETTNPIFGRTNNPWALERSAGGSSGGEAAIIAAGGSPLGIGTDMAGSIRLPSAFCGVAGIKPTARLIPFDGNYPPAPEEIEELCAVGPLGRSVDDLALAVSVMAGRPALADLDAVKLGGRPVVRMDGNGLIPVPGTIRAAIGRAVDALAGAGMRGEAHRLRHSFHAAWLWIDRAYRPAFALHPHLIEEGAPRNLPLAAWQTVWGHGPVSGPVAWSLTMIALLGTALSPLHGTLERMRAELREDLRRVAGEGVIVLPAFPGPAPRHNWVYLRVVQAAYFFLANLAGAPALSVPAGLSREGLPLAVQILGPPGADRVVLAAGRVVEEALGGWRGPVEPGGEARRQRDV